MNEVDFLLRNKFSLLTFEQKLEVKRLGPHKPENFLLINSKTEQIKHKKKLTFQHEWFRRKSWLTASMSKKSLFCFPCLLFGGDTVWSNLGFKDLKHLSERLTKHEHSGSHMKNAITLQLFGKTNVIENYDSEYLQAIHHHNNEVDKNRYMLSKMITVLKLCGSCQLNINEDDAFISLKPRIFQSIFEMLREDDPVLRSYHGQLPAFKDAFKTIEHELLDCMYAVYKDHIKNEIEKAHFVSVEIDKITDTFSGTQTVVTIRYMLPNDIVVERFVECKDMDTSKSNIPYEIKMVLHDLEIEKNKLIAYTFDGATIINERLKEVQGLVKKEYPSSHFVHCYAHQLNYIVQQFCSQTHKEIKVFFAHLSQFFVFFSISPKHISKLNDIITRKQIEMNVNLRDFKNKPVSLIHDHIEELRECMRLFQEEFSWDTETINQSYALLNLLNDSKFTNFISFFKPIMIEVDSFYNETQNLSNELINDLITSFKNTIRNIEEQVDELFNCNKDEMTNIPVKKRKIAESDTSIIMKNTCDIINRNIENRFVNSGYLITAKLFEINLFDEYAKHFPDREFNVTAEYYPLLDKHKLKTELSILYGHSELLKYVNSATSLLNSLSRNNVKEVFSETTTLLEMLITTPMTTRETDRYCPTFQRINNCLHNIEKTEQLNAFAMLSIEQKLVKSIPDFNDKVIERFASLQNRRGQFCYKKPADAEGNNNGNR